MGRIIKDDMHITVESDTSTTDSLPMEIQNSLFAITNYFLSECLESVSVALQAGNTKYLLNIELADI